MDVIKDQKAVIIATLNSIHNACCINDNTSDNNNTAGSITFNNTGSTSVSKKK